MFEKEVTQDQLTTFIASLVNKGVTQFASVKISDTYWKVSYRQV